MRRLDEPRRRYVLTLRVAALASQSLARHEPARAAAPVVALLHTQTALTAHLVSPSYDCVLCLVHAAEEGTSAPRLRELVPAHCTAGGKALLAGRDHWRASLLSRPLRAYTDQTVTDPCAVKQEAATTRERGYAIEDGEYHPDARAVAAPVHDGAPRHDRRDRRQHERQPARRDDERLRRPGGRHAERGPRRKGAAATGPGSRALADAARSTAWCGSSLRATRVCAGHGRRPDGMPSQDL